MCPSNNWEAPMLSSVITTSCPSQYFGFLPNIFDKYASGHSRSIACTAEFATKTLEGEQNIKCTMQLYWIVLMNSE